MSSANLKDDKFRSEATFTYTVKGISDHKTQQVPEQLSEPHYVRMMPWKTVVRPNEKAFGFFLQCNGENESPTWSCKAIAELRLKSFKPNTPPFTRAKIKHLFYSKENDYGYSNFIEWSNLMDPEKGYVQNGTCVLEVHVIADAPHGVVWDSDSTATNTSTYDIEQKMSSVNFKDDKFRSEATFTYTVEGISDHKTQQVPEQLSEPHYVRMMPWKIVVRPNEKALGFFLQCNGENESPTWSCKAIAELRLKSFKPNTPPFTRAKIKHLFYSKENDYGYSNFIEWSKLMDPEKGYVQNRTCVLEVHVIAEVPYGIP